MEYRILDFLMSGNIIISPDAQNAAAYPFTMECVRRFFKEFEQESFSFDGAIGSIMIMGGKENLPRHSFASGVLFPQTLDEQERPGRFAKPVGSIHMECGGNISTPVIRVGKQGYSE
jgi:hypothetical protein